jgi:hypothetical protein
VEPLRSYRRQPSERVTAASSCGGGSTGRPASSSMVQGLCVVAYVPACCDLLANRSRAFPIPIGV